METEHQVNLFWMVIDHFGIENANIGTQYITLHQEVYGSDFVEAREAFKRLISS